MGNTNLLKISPEYTRAGVYGKCVLTQSNCAGWFFEVFIVSKKCSI